MGSFFDLTDSAGIPWDLYTLSIYEGNASKPLVMLSAGLMQLSWAVYLLVISLMIKALDLIVAMDWVDWLLSPMHGMSTIVDNLISQFGIGLLMLTVMGIVAFIHIFRGRAGTGIGELVIGCTIAALAVGVLADPWGMIAEAPNGYIYQARDAGFEIAAITDTGSTDGAPASNIDDQRSTISQSLFDVAVRLPHQLVNYGQVIDGTSCEEAYNAALLAGADGLNPHDQIHDAPECDDALYDYANTPDALSVAATWIVWPTGIAVVLLAFSLALIILGAVLVCAWQAVQALWNLVLGVVSGPSRVALLTNLTVTAYSCFMIAGGIVFLVGWMQIVQGAMSIDFEIPVMLRFVVIDIVLLVGLVALWMARAKVKKAAIALAHRLAKIGVASAPASPVAGRMIDFTRRRLEDLENLKTLRGNDGKPSTADAVPSPGNAGMRTTNQSPSPNSPQPAHAPPSPPTPAPGPPTGQDPAAEPTEAFATPHHTPEAETDVLPEQQRSMPTEGAPPSDHAPGRRRSTHTSAAPSGEPDDGTPQGPAPSAAPPADTTPSRSPKNADLRRRLGRRVAGEAVKHAVAAAATGGSATVAKVAMTARKVQRAQAIHRTARNTALRAKLVQDHRREETNR